ncbi:MAG: pyruvate dehydrogenase (acetyl-transferring) E1 component subunit alpha [Ktedonobacteraceae bacterium]
MAIEIAAIGSLLETMYTIRYFEEAVRDKFAEKLIPGFIHLSIGQEAVAVGVAAALRPEDYVYVTHRGHGYVIAKGANLERVAAEIFGRTEGYCHGRGGSMHIAAFDVGILGANGIVGAGLPQAVGAAYALQTLGLDRVVVVVFGDGAVNEGVFHESLNIASLWRLPVIFLCENNLYAEFTPTSIHSALENVSERAAAYNMPGQRVDGRDPLAVQKAVAEAGKRARTSGGPTLVECLTQRHRGHYEGDAQRYRAATELDDMKAQDPIDLFIRRFEGDGTLNSEEIATIAQRARDRSQAAIDYALQCELPASTSALENVLA